MKRLGLVIAAAIGGAALAADAACPGSVDMAQGWDCALQQRFWYTSQGSLLLPAQWFLALEKESSSTPFIDPANMSRFKFLPGRTEGSFPIGFARARFKKTDYVGLTCAACHTALLTWNGNQMLVDGGPAMIHFELFLDDLVKALRSTLTDAGKRARFRAKLDPMPSDEVLRQDLKSAANELAALMEKAQPHQEYGFGRVDAFGYIFNRVTNKARPATAPVSYPHLWTTPRLTFVQWNGAAPNAGIGPLLRNIGEVLGVFATLDPNTLSGVGWLSSVDFGGLRNLETWLSTLRAPKWPSQLGGPWAVGDVSAGAKLFTANCASCHLDLKGDPGTGSTADLEVETLRLSASETAPDTADRISTDPQMAANFVAWQKQPAGYASGFPSLFTTGGDILNRSVVMAYLGGNPVILDSSSASLDGLLSTLQVYLQRFTPHYRARPLNGIWATAPYLHNGSVPTLTELLNKPGSRKKKFCVGNREYDPENVGFVTELWDTGDRNCPDGMVFDATNPGNYNLGHDYGTNLGPDEKKQLIAYLKTL